MEQMVTLGTILELSVMFFRYVMESIMFILHNIEHSGPRERARTVCWGS